MTRLERQAEARHWGFCGLDRLIDQRSAKWRTGQCAAPKALTSVKRHCASGSGGDRVLLDANKLSSGMFTVEERSFCKIAGLIFLAIAAAQFVRLAGGWVVLVNGNRVPLWTSG